MNKSKNTNQNVKYKDYKYNLLKILQTEYPMDECRMLKKEIPEMLNVSTRTFNGWCYLKKDNKNTIRYIELYKLAKILNTSVEKLINFDIDFEVVRQNKTA